MVLVKKVAIYNWEWGRISAPYRRAENALRVNILHVPFVCSCRRLCTVATENNRNASTEPPPPAKDSKTQGDTNDAVPDTEVEEVMVDKGPSEAEKALQAENKKIKKELDGAKV